MKILNVCVLTFIALSSIQAVTSFPIPDDKLVDLSYAFDESTIGWPTDKPFKINITRNGTTPEGYWLQEDEYSTGTHVGTHLDAPCHTAIGAWTTDQIPLSRFYGPAAVVDITQRAARDRDALMRISDLVNWELTSGRTLDYTIVLVRSGWGQKWPDKEAYLGNANNDVNNLHFPGVSAEAAQWLVDNRKIYGLGIDTASLDNGPSKDLQAHQILLGANIYGIENVANLEKLPQNGAFLHVLPMKIRNASGGPVRIVAFLPL